MHQSYPIITDSIGHPFIGHQFHSRTLDQPSAHSKEHQFQTRTLIQPSAQSQDTNSKPGHWSNHQPIHRVLVPNQELVQPSFKHYI